MNRHAEVFDGPSRLSGTLEEGQHYDYAVIEMPDGRHFGGVCLGRHDDGTATVNLGGLMHMRGRLLRFVPRRGES